jgi:predicted dehydrogenase
MTLKVGIVGMGAISRFYLPALRKAPDVELVAVCDLDLRRCAPLADEIACFASHTELLDAGGVDAVVVNVPNDCHYDVCRHALRHGVHVCVEKPLAVDVTQAVALHELSVATGRTLFTAFHRRYNANFVALATRLQSGDGIARVDARYLERIEDHVGGDKWYLDPGRCGGGCVADNGPNVYELLRTLLGPLEVVDAVLRREDGEADTHALVTLRSRAGIPVSAELDWRFGDGERKDLDVWLADGRRLRADLLEGFAAFKSSLFHEYEGVVDDFATAVRTGRGRGEDGLEAAHLVRATYRAAGAGRPPAAR